MASKHEETPQKEEMLEKETLPDSPLLDLWDPAVEELIRSGKKRGYVTHNQINSVLPPEPGREGTLRHAEQLFLSWRWRRYK
jgi:RNA polymerase primary sigma factor